MKKTLLASAAALALLAAVPALAAPDDHHGGGGGSHEAAAPAPHPAGGGGGGHAGGFGAGSDHHGGGNQGHGVVGNTGGSGSSNAMTGGTGHREHDRGTGGASSRNQTDIHNSHSSDANVVRDRTDITINNNSSNTAHDERRGNGSHGEHVTGTAIFGTGGHGFQAAPGRHVDHGSAQIRQLRANRSASRHFHAGSYNGPRGYSYHRWSYGDFLPALYFTNDYWLNDYDDYGLPYAPPGTLWVRYGDDALLVDRYTGEIITVEYGLFD